MKRNVRYSEINKEPRAPGRYTQDLEYDSHGRQLKMNSGAKLGMSTPKCNSHSRQLRSESKLRMSTPQGLGVECSDMPIGASDELDFLLMRRDRLHKQIECSFENLCEQLTSSGIGRGGARSGAFSQVVQFLVPKTVLRK